VDFLSATFSALADPTRRSIVDRLTRGAATINELAEPFAMSQQAISKHVAYLERAGVVTKQRIGRQHLCQLRPGAIEEVAIWAERYRQLWESRFQRLDAVLVELVAEASPPLSPSPISKSRRERA